MRTTGPVTPLRRAAAIWAVLVLMLFSLTGCDGPGEPAGESAASDTDGSGIPAPGSSTHSGWSQIVLPEPTTAPATAAATTVPVQVADPDDVSEAPPALPPEEDEPLCAGLTPIRKTAYYGLQVLQSMPRSDNLVAAYHRLVAGVEACETTISLKDSQYPLTPDELTAVLTYYRFDYPQHFWLDQTTGKFSYTYAGNTVLTITLSYSLTGSALTEAKAAFETAAAGMLEGIDGGMPEAERERLLHDRLVQAVSYDTGLDKPNIYNAYGAIVDRVAVCEGYARAMQYLLYQAGIQCLMATGSSKGETHAWNVVRIDGAYYHLDPTWDDPVGQTGFDFISYAYYNLTDEEIRRDHEIDAESGYPLPACTDTAAHYYRSRGLVYTSYSAADVAALIREAREQGLTLVRLWVDGDADAYSRFILDDWDAICRQAGYQGGIRLIPPNTSEILFSLS